MAKIPQAQHGRQLPLQLNHLLYALRDFGAPPITPPKVPPQTQRTTTATTDELSRLMASPPAWLRLYMLLYFQCGLRRAETLRITPRTWNPERHSVTIEVKGGRDRTAQVTPEVEALFTACGPTDPDTPFLYALRGKPLTPSGILKAWHVHRKKCGVNPALPAHDLRRTAATILYHATKDLRVAQQLLGHKSLTSTLSYIAPLAPEETQKHQALLTFDRFKSEVKQ